MTVPGPYPNRIREWRNSRGKTLDELGGLVGLSGGQISRLETGSRRVSLDRLQEIARALDCRTEDLLPVDAPAGVYELLAAYRRLSPDGRRLLLAIADNLEGWSLACRRDDT